MMQLSKEKDRRTVKPGSYVNYYDKVDHVQRISQFHFFVVGFGVLEGW